ncbi:gliding motility-associated C-terminal domain-containing protein [Hymenobacter profundi]|uniref:Gliding motility-associated C-terminal domain-containing protein n=1 Tax=Hymenobacter profundi TaxID=1982110 RepID=A0ABS6WX84_9BACT|nr:gliding motility-associated C-terminal domain-containing protein [Hymenobacter profundi]MBW3127364.1 gliding motility-associated C-terminal domain-containing protein [Hymenobacter profundi]
MLISTLRTGLCALITSLITSTLPAFASATPDARTLEFVENRGQWNDQAAFAAELPAGRLFLSPTRFTYAFVDPAALRAHHDHVAAEITDQVRAHAYSVEFVGANPDAVLQGEEPTAGQRNYFLGNQEERWASAAQGYHTVRYDKLYPGIGMRLYENSRQLLEYDFTVQPGAQPEQISLRYDGAQLRLDHGNLVITTSVGHVTEQAPQAWQERNGRRVAVPVAFVLTGNTLTFQLGKYDHRLPLVIDPTLEFSSFTGSTADNWGFTATYDAQSNMYSGGTVFALGFPVSRGAYSTSWSGNTDIGIIKYNTKASGTATRLYATYIGGSGAEVPQSLVVNPQGELVILGSTSSGNYPTSAGAYDRTYNGGTTFTPDPGLDYPGGSDIIISKLSANGSALLASTYLGSSANDGILERIGDDLVQNYGDQFRGDVTTDAEGNVYLASSTTGNNFPATGFQRRMGGGISDAVICKFSADLHTLAWSTYLGGAGNDAAYSIQVDKAHEVFICGGTVSSNLPGTTGSYRPTRQGGIDGFAARISADGATLEHLTYLGTSATDQAYFLQLDGDENVYILGQTRGRMTATAGVYGVPNGHQFVQKLDHNLTRSEYISTFGSGAADPNISPTAFLVDECERIYISGWGGNTNYSGNTYSLPTTANAIQKETDGSDFYLAQFTPGMVRLEYATFFGGTGRSGEHVDGGTSRFDKRGVVYQAVCGGCGGNSSFPIPPGASTYSSTNRSSNCNNAAFKIDFLPVRSNPGPVRYVCASASPMTLGGTPAGGTWSGPGVTRTASGSYQFSPANLSAGSYFLTYSAPVTGTCVSSTTVRYVITGTLPVALTAMPTLCVSSTAALPLAAAVAGGTWSGPGVANNSFTPSRAGAGTHTLTYSLADTVSCTVSTMAVTVQPLPIITTNPVITLCADQLQAFQLPAASPAGGTWTGTGVSSSGMFTPPDTKGKGANITLTYRYATLDGCENTGTQQVVLAPVSASNVVLNVPECTAAPQYAGLAPFTVQFEPILPGGSYEWDFGDNTKSTDANPSHEYTKGGSYRVQLTARYANCVVVTQFAPVEVGDVFVPNIFTPNHDTKNETFVPRFSCQPAALKMFNRWGTKVYETETYRNDWHADNLPDGVYYYHLRDTAGRTIKGWVEVRR